MAFVRPSLAELVDRIQEDLESRLELTGSVLRRSMVYVLARVLAGAAHMLHGHLEFLSKQLFADQSEAEFLRRQGSLYGVVPNEATYATGEILFTGDEDTVIPEGTIVSRSDGVQYATDAEVTIDEEGEAAVDVTAVEAGEDGNCDEGVVLTLESPISGVDSEATVGEDGLSGGTDQEDDEDYRIRVLERLRSPPHGGSEADYIAWAKEVSGVTRVWVSPLELGVGTVVVRFVRDDDDDLIPSAGEVDEVQDYIDERRPVTADVTVLAPTDTPMAVTLSITPDNSAVRAAVEAELEDLLRREAEPGETVLLSHIRTAIGIAEGLTNYTLASPAADVTHTANQLATLGTVTFT